VSGVFDVGDTQAFVAAVTAVFNLQAAPAADGDIRLKPRDSRSVTPILARGHSDHAERTSSWNRSLSPAVSASAL
jgi:hypothetical protein